MHTSRRQLLQGVGAGIVLGSLPSMVSAQTAVSSSGVGLPNQRLNIVSFDALEAQAKQKMSPAAYAFIGHGSGDEWTMRENRRAFNDYLLRTHRLNGIAATDIDLSVKVLGHTLPFPIMVAPMGGHMFVHPQGEVATASGAGYAGTLYQSSGTSNKPMEHIAQATTGPKWFQLYMNNDVGVTRSLLQRAKAAGFSAIILTADALGPGASDEFIRLGRPFPAGFTMGNYDPKFGGSGNVGNQKINLTPDDIGFIREVSGLPVVVKGIMRGVDADTAIRAGAAAIQVSNHGGRQLDGVPASISVLQEVATAVGGRVPVYFDSGIRRGVDVIKAVALGADAVAIGRPVLFALTLGGALGVQSAIEHLRDEVKTAMLSLGAKNLADLRKDYIKQAIA